MLDRQAVDRTTQVYGEIRSMNGAATYRLFSELCNRRITVPLSVSDEGMGALENMCDIYTFDTNS